MKIMILTILLEAILQSQSDVANQFNDYLILGYVAMWIVGSVYVISLFTRQRNLREDIRLMRQLLREDEETADE
jgi:hypothetical protein